MKQEPPPSDPMSASHQIRLQPSTSTQMHHHQQHQLSHPQQQNTHLHSSKMDSIQVNDNIEAEIKIFLQIIPSSGSMSFPPPQRSQSTSLSSPVVKQEIKQEPFLRSPVGAQQCLPPQSPQSRPNNIRSNRQIAQSHNQPGTSRQAVTMMETQVDSSSLNSVRADPAFNFTINAEHSLNLDIDTSFGDFDIALPQFDQPTSLSLNTDQRQHAHHQQQSFMARP